MKKLLQRLFGNFRYKISSVILACLLWYIVQGEQIIEINRTITVNIDVPEEFMIKGETTRVKYATIRGPRVLMGDMATRPIEANVGIDKAKSGVHRLRISKDTIANWDDRIKINIEDPDLPIIMDKRLTRPIPVKEVLQGVPAEGYIVEKTTIKPRMVQLTGLRNEVNKIKEIYTEPIDIGAIQQSKSYEARLQAPQGMTAKSLSDETAQVSVSVGEKKINKRYGSIPVAVVGSEYRTNVTPRYVSILIQGTPGVLSFVKRSDLRAFIEVSELKPGRYEKEIQVKIPANTVLIETFPENATVEIAGGKRINE